MQKDPDFIDFVRRGWIEVGGARMSLVEIKGGFYGLREVLARQVGETEDDLVCHAGLQGSASFMTSAMESGQIAADKEGFKSALDTYSEAGFGNFEAAELFWKRGWAIIHCSDSFEGWAYVQNENLQSCPKCDYTRGVLLAFMSETHRHAETGVEELSVIESACIGKGDEKCEFLIGTRADLEAYGYEVPPPKLSVREKLERSIGLLRDSNKRLMKTEMQYRNLFDVTFNSILIVNRELQVTECNLPAEILLSAKKDIIVGKKLAEYLPAVREASFKEEIEGVFKLNKIADFTSDVRTSSGETRRCNIRVSPIYEDLAVVFQAAEQAAQH